MEIRKQVQTIKMQYNWWIAILILTIQVLIKETISLILAILVQSTKNYQIKIRNRRSLEMCKLTLEIKSHQILNQKKIKTKHLLIIQMKIPRHFQI